MNSLAADFSGQVIDFYEGQRDISNRTLRATSNQFSEDPLRVLRGMQFAARFDMVLDRKTKQLCQSMAATFCSLARERVWTEFHKLMDKGRHIGQGLKLLQESEWLANFPDLLALASCPQDSEWHPEGDVWQHTSHVCDAANEIAVREELLEQDRLVLMFSALLHDIGKPATTVRNDTGHWSSPGHAGVGVDLATRFLQSIAAPNWLIEQVAPLVCEHMAHVGISQPGPRIVRRLSTRVSPSTMKLWGHLVEADHSGRPPLPKGNPAASFVEIARELALELEKPKPLLLGRHLIQEFGMSPGPEFSPILAAAFEAQLDDGWILLDEAIAWARQNQN